jgi:hypothetical protein
MFSKAGVERLRLTGLPKPHDGADVSNARKPGHCLAFSLRRPSPRTLIMDHGAGRMPRAQANAM